MLPEPRSGTPRTSLSVCAAGPGSLTQSILDRHDDRSGEVPSSREQRRLHEQTGGAGDEDRTRLSRLGKPAPHPAASPAEEEWDRGGSPIAASARAHRGQFRWPAPRSRGAGAGGRTRRARLGRPAAGPPATPALAPTLVRACARCGGVGCAQLALRAGRDPSEPSPRLLRNLSPSSVLPRPPESYKDPVLAGARGDAEAVTGAAPVAKPIPTASGRWTTRPP